MTSKALGKGPEKMTYRCSSTMLAAVYAVAILGVFGCTRPVSEKPDSGDSSSQAKSSQVTLGDPSLTAGIPGSGDPQAFLRKLDEMCRFAVLHLEVHRIDRDAGRASLRRARLAVDMFLGRLPADELFDLVDPDTDSRSVESDELSSLT